MYINSICRLLYCFALCCLKHNKQKAKAKLGKKINRSGMAAVASEGGGGGGETRVSQSIPDHMRKTIETIREITGKQHSDEEIYAVHMECAMDPNETAQKLLYLGIFTSLAIYVVSICIRVFAALGVFLCIRVL